jgi:hypothetical protein
MQEWKKSLELWNELRAIAHRRMQMKYPPALYCYRTDGNIAGP